MNAAEKLHPKISMAKGAAAAALLLALGGGAQAGPVPHVFTSGTPAKATEMNANFTYVAERLVPAGVIVPFAGTNAPPGWLLCDGQAVSREDYAELFAVIGTSHGAGNDKNTFNLPDYRGRFLRGVDGQAGRDPDRESRTEMNRGGNTGNQVGSVQNESFKSHTHSFSFKRTVLTIGSGSRWASDISSEGGYNTTTTGQIGNTGGSETRPVNANVNFLIKY